MNHLADVNIQSSVGMFIFYAVLHCFVSTFCIRLLCLFVPLPLIDVLEVL